MDNKIISVIYSTYLDNEFIDLPALNYYDLSAEYKKLDEFLEKHNISLEERNDLDSDIISEFTNKSEKIGFTNGFKLALRLVFETIQGM